MFFNKESNLAKAQYDFSMQQLSRIEELVDAGVQPMANKFDSEATLASDEQRLTVAENNLDLH